VTYEPLGIAAYDHSSPALALTAAERFLELRAQIPVGGERLATNGDFNFHCCL
jgi:hypothetical protein